MIQRKHLVSAILVLAIVALLVPAALAAGESGAGLGDRIAKDFTTETGEFHGIVFLKGIPLGNQVVAASIIFVVLVVVALVVGKSVRNSGDDVVPSTKFGLRTFVEIITETTLGMMEQIIGPEYRRFFPLIGTLAFFILFSNIMGLIPGMYTSTDNINTNASMALIVFFCYHYWGIRKHCFFSYMKHMMTGGMPGILGWILAPLLFPIEVISHCVRPLSLSVRLFGNMYGDHKVMAMFVGLIAIPNIIPVPFFALGLIVCIVQTLVFCLLSCVYIGLATAAEEH